MFGFFKKAKPTAVSIGLFQKLAQEAVIKSVLENGSYSGFLIYTTGDASFFDPRASNADSIAAFVKTIENRIAEGDFDDLLDHSLRQQLGLPLPTHDFGKSTVRRVIIGENRTKLFDWPGPGTVVLQPPSNKRTVQLPQKGATPKANLAKKFKLSFFHIKIETEADGGYPFKLTATDSRTNQFAFSYGLEVSPFASCLVSVFADGTRVNMGPPFEAITLESFEKLAVAFAIEKINDDQLLTDNAMHAIGAYAVTEKFGKAGFQVLALNKDVLDEPQIIAMKDGKIVGVIVRADAFPHKGTLWDRTEEELKKLIGRYEERGQDLYFASVILSNANAKNDYERRVLLRGGSFHMSVEEFSKLQEIPKMDFSDRNLTPPELALIGEFGALVAGDLADKIALPKTMEEIVHPEYSILGVYLAARVYLDFTEQNDEIQWTVLGILTSPPFVQEVVSEEDEEVARFERFAGAAILAYEHEAARYLKAGSSQRKSYAEFGKAATRVMLARMKRYQGFQKSAVNIENMQDAVALQPEVLEVSFQEMRAACKLSINP